MPKTEEANKSRQVNSVIATCFCSQRTKRSFSRADSQFSRAGWIRIKYSGWKARKVYVINFIFMLPWLAASNWTFETTAIRAPVYPVYGVRQTNNGCTQAYFFFPFPPPPPPLFWPINLSLGIIFWLARTLCQFNVQIIRTALIRLLLQATLKQLYLRS